MKEDEDHMKLSIENIENQEFVNRQIFVGLEKNLIQIGFFSIPNFKDSINKQEKMVKLTTFETDRVSSQVEILAPRKVGLPTTGDLTLYLAFQAIVQEKHAFKQGPLINPITFTNYELLNRAQIAICKSAYEDVRDWLLRMKSTTVQFHAADAKRKGTDAVSVFDRVVSASETLDSGETADCNYVWLSDWGIENLRSVVPIDLVTYGKLKNQTARILVPHLQVWLYASRNQNIFRKTYSQFCALLGSVEYSHRSKILEKLDSAMSELGKYEYIKNWEVTGDRRRGFVISITHGPKFFRDQKLFFVLNGQKSDSQGDNNTSTPEIVLLPEVQLSEDQNRVHSMLVGKGIRPKDALKFIKGLTIQDVEDRIGFCDYMITESPGRIKSESGYLFTILKDDEFTVPAEYITWKAKMVERRDISEEPVGEQGMLTEASKDLLASFSQYEKFCLENSHPIDEKFFERDAADGQVIWIRTLKEINRRLNEHIIQSWFSSLRYFAYSRREKAIVVMANPVTVEWISKYYTQLLVEVIDTVGAEGHTIQWYARNSDDLHLSDLEPRSDRDLFRIFQYQQNGLSFEEFQENEKAMNQKS